ncbi:AAA family ATPase [Kineococcus sp. SYSU DK003]|uniref:AAA family ATPase n=1 Tax=Kineococcus sp. SYSU DK003 TaxID=3383124 RepID=UPI003D7E22ED
MAEAVVLVNGVPGAGKTTLARELAGRTSWPCLSKDDVKELLAALAPAVGSARSGALAMDTVWALARECDGVVVVDSWWFRPRDLEFARAGLTTSGAQRSVELWCEVPVEEARRRYAHRTRAAVHQDDRRLVTDWPTWAVQAEPLALGGVVRVDTSGPVDVGELLRRIEEVPGWGSRKP